ncbi:hypothetical protein [Halorientalis regularis]|uniref:hypothetical protein n=1 Tax=Halorientalis regularis TaxID=660518 RepID=UPI001113A641|nr:hypothetical protein [Halorientalis regularis]
MTRRTRRRLLAGTAAAALAGCAGPEDSGNETSPDGETGGTPDGGGPGGTPEGDTATPTMPGEGTTTEEPMSPGEETETRTLAMPENETTTTEDGGFLRPDPRPPNRQAGMDFYPRRCNFCRSS